MHLGKTRTQVLNSGHNLHKGEIFLQYIIKATVLWVPVTTKALYFIPVTSLDNLRNVHIKLYLQ